MELPIRDRQLLSVFDQNERVGWWLVVFAYGAVIVWNLIDIVIAGAVFGDGPLALVYTYQMPFLNYMHHALAIQPIWYILLTEAVSLMVPVWLVYYHLWPSTLVAGGESNGS